MSAEASHQGRDTEVPDSSGLQGHPEHPDAEHPDVSTSPGVVPVVGAEALVAAVGQVPPTLWA